MPTLARVLIMPGNLTLARALTMPGPLTLARPLTLHGPLILARPLTLPGTLTRARTLLTITWTPKARTWWWSPPTTLSFRKINVFWPEKQIYAICGAVDFKIEAPANGTLIIKTISRIQTKALLNIEIYLYLEMTRLC